MALAALSLSSHGGNERLDALQHYQKALPALQNSLRSTEDLSSDGAFLTHFVLLVYEVSEVQFWIWVCMLTTNRLLQPKLVTQTCGHSISLPYCVFPCYDVKYLVANGSHTSFGGFPTLTWTHYLAELEEVNLLGQC